MNAEGGGGREGAGKKNERYKVIGEIEQFDLRLVDERNVIERIIREKENRKKERSGRYIPDSLFNACSRLRNDESAFRHSFINH